jgi:cob(I)alamin adenosyltransferase
MAFRIYTRTGDSGETSLFGGRRLPKDHLRIDTYGTVDELNAFLGLTNDHLAEAGFHDLLSEIKGIQDLLFTLGSRLASDPEKELDLPGLQSDDVSSLERAIDRMDAELPELRNFILPGGHPAVFYCHVSRCVCRRAERLAVALAASEPVDEIILTYLNRLSDFLFVLARYVGHRLGRAEVVWAPRDFS